MVGGGSAGHGVRGFPPEGGGGGGPAGPLEMAASLGALGEKLVQLSEAGKAQIVIRLLPSISRAFAGIEKKPGVCGGDACIVRTRIPVWTLERYRRLGATEATILDNFPTLRAADLVNAWSYVDGHREEIEASIRENEDA